MDAIQEFVCEQGPLMNQRFQTPRGYGYAVYRLVGGHGAWHNKNAQKMYISVNHSEKKWFAQKNSAIRKKQGYTGYAIAVIREGGYDRTSELPTFAELLREVGFTEVSQ